MACRNTEAAEKAALEIKSLNSSNEEATGELVVAKLDLGNLASVRSFAENIVENEKRVDILINNAGIYPAASNRSETDDGLEQTIGVNHFGPFLLTNLLTKKLSQSPELPSRIINVASRAHKRGEINLEDINSQTEYNGFAAYNQSKLANILFTKELSQRLTTNGQNISVYCLHPGVIYTNLFREFDRKYGVLMKFVTVATWPFLKSSKEGAQTTIYCATEETIANDTGKYYSDCKEATPSSQGLDDVLAKKLWKLSENTIDLLMKK